MGESKYHRSRHLICRALCIIFHQQEDAQGKKPEVLRLAKECPVAKGVICSPGEQVSTPASAKGLLCNVYIQALRLR